MLTFPKMTGINSKIKINPYQILPSSAVYNSLKLFQFYKHTNHGNTVNIDFPTTNLRKKCSGAWN